MKKYFNKNAFDGHYSFSCTEKESVLLQSNKSSSTFSLIGTWKTRVITSYNKIQTRAIDGTIKFILDSVFIDNSEYTREVSGDWEFNEHNIFRYGYYKDNYFIQMIMEHDKIDNDLIFHYSIEADKLTFNSAEDRGGIFKGNSNEFIGQVWTYETNYYNEDEQKKYITLNQYQFNENGSGYRFRNYITENTIDTTHITYLIDQNNLTIYGENWDEPYVGIYEITNNKLYIYGKPWETDNDDYNKIVWVREN